MSKDYDITKTKLVIWDLDETFWNGSLSEEKISFKPEVLKFVQELVLKGIMNSICSKNDFEKVKSEFINNGLKNIWDLFLFPSIDWTLKGQRIKEIIKKMNLREENVIFIDDNSFNLNEAKFHCPQIMTAEAFQIPKLIEELYLVNDYDFEYTRLKQYKILENKTEEKEALNLSNNDFLKNSEIKIAIKKDCESNLERIYNLVHRTNQLNFTKNRVEKEKLKRYFNNPAQYDSAYVLVQDKYGNYGICGFYVLDKEKNKLEHFLFSCRIMNMGIEQFVYSYLKNPKLEIQGEVSSSLDYTPDWVELVPDLELFETKQSQNNDINILLKGPCDLYSTLNYIDTDSNIDTEFPYWNKKPAYILAHTHTAFIEQTHKFPPEKLAELSKKFPFPDPDEFKTRFFDKKYNLVFLSLLTTTHSGIYQNKTDGSYAFFGYTNCDITDEDNREKILAPLPDEAKKLNLIMLNQFKKDYVFCGNPPVETVINNLKYIRENLAPETSLVLILGSEVPCPRTQAGYENMDQRHKILNEAVREFADGCKNIDIIELTDLIRSEEDYGDCINHFSRQVYYSLAGEIIAKSNQILGGNYLKIKNI